MRILFSAILLGVTVSFSFAAPLLDSFRIQFNWDLNSALEDAIPVYSDNEDIRENPDVFEFAYLFYSNPKIKLQVYTTCTNNFILLINARNTEGNGFDTCYYNYAYIPGTVIEIPIPITNYISKYHFTWEWTITAIPICNTGAGFTANTLTRTTEQHLYVILEDPQAPMNPPWAGVLEYACEWAEEESYIEDAITKITEHLYSSGYNYSSDGGATYSHKNSVEKPFHFNVSQMVIDFLDPEGITVNCLDMARAVTTLGNAIGANLQVIKFSRKINNDRLIPVNYIDPIGSYPPTNSPFFRYDSTDCRIGGFNFHAFAQMPIDTLVWDATLRYDIDEYPDNVVNSNPTCGGTNNYVNWQLPCNISISTYLNNLVDDWVKPNNYIGIDCSNPLDCGEISDSYFIIPY
ncbi:MAG: hypothetical protein U0T82_02670 [Bacteroidales bacterium]